MARICSGCNKFASLEPEVEDISGEVTNDGQGGANVSISAEVVLMSACCGQEVARASIEDDYDIGAECFEHADDCDYRTEGEPADDKDEPDEEVWKSDVQFSVDDISGDAGERMQDTDRRGKKIRSYRYMRKFYTVEVSGTVTCDGCAAEHPFACSVEEQASGFEDSN